MFGRNEIEVAIFAFWGLWELLVEPRVLGEGRGEEIWLGGGVMIFEAWKLEREFKMYTV